MRDQEIIGLQEAYLEVYEEVDTRRAPKEMLDRLNASREGHMAQDGANKPAYDAKQRLLKKAHKKRTEISEAQEEGRRARKRYKNAPSYDQVKAGIDAKEKAAAERKAERAAARRPLTPGERYEQEKAARGKKYSSDVNPYFNPRSVREEVLSYLLDEGFASDEKSAEAIMCAMSEAWIGSIVEQASTVASSGGAGGKVTADKQYPATLRGLKGVKSTDSKGTEYFQPYTSSGRKEASGKPFGPTTMPDTNRAQYKQLYSGKYENIPASQSTKNPESHLSRTGIPKVRSATSTYGID